MYYEFTTRPAPIWLDSSIGRALHQHRRGSGFKSCSSLIFFFPGFLYVTVQVVYITVMAFHFWMSTRLYWEHREVAFNQVISSAETSTEQKYMYFRQSLKVHSPTEAAGFIYEVFLSFTPDKHYIFGITQNWGGLKHLHQEITLLEEAVQINDRNKATVTNNHCKWLHFSS